MRITAVSQPCNINYDALKAGLNGFNDHHTGKLLREKIASFAKDDENQTIGGIAGEIKWGWLYIEGLWIDESYRGQQLGSKLLGQLENYAQSKGIYNYRLETTSFQALGFYEKHHYCVFGQLADMPPGHTSYFLKKELPDN